MRIVAGYYRSRIIKAPNNDLTRPTSDMIRESLFNALGTKCIDANCLDIFAGSGALGIEAISRGAKHCTFIDQDSVAIKTITDNVNTLKIKNASIIKNDYSYINQLNEMFDIVFFDPPYKMDVFDEIFDIIQQKGLLNSKGVIVYESNKQNMLSKTKDGFVLKQYFHRDTVLNVLKKVL